MEVWLSYDNKKEKFQLPVTPSTYQVGVDTLTDKVEVTGIGMINLIGNSDLKALTIESFFPVHNYSFIETNKLLKPFEYVKMLEKWRISKEPIRVIFTDTPINYPMVIESFSWGEEDGTGDVYFTLELTEYKFLKLTKASKSKTVVKQTKRPVKKSKSTKYTVKRGDSLWKISKKFYGSGTKWKKIYNNNKKVIGKNPNLIYPGQKLVIPK